MEVFALRLGRRRTALQAKHEAGSPPSGVAAGGTDSASDPMRLLRLTGWLYVAAVAAVVAGGNGLMASLRAQLPEDAGAGGLITVLPAFDQFLSLITALLALYLGIWSAEVGLCTGRLLLGFGLLAGGVAATALAFMLLPTFRIPALGHTASSVWVFGNGFIYVGAWLATSVAGILKEP